MNIISGDIEKLDAERVNQACKMLKSGNVLAAEEILLQVIKNAPSPEDYVYQYEDDNSLSIKFLDSSEFTHYVIWQEERQALEKNVDWILSAYPRAFFYLGFINVEKGDPLRAIEYLDKGAMLEPTNPKFILEKAHIYGQMKDFQTALNLFEQVAELSAHVCQDDLAKALRGKGFVLIECGELNLAEAALRESLQYDPRNSVAADELAYIAHLREGSQKTKGVITRTDGVDPRTCMECGKQNVYHIYTLVREGRMINLCEKCHRKLII